MAETKTTHEEQSPSAPAATAAPSPAKPGPARPAMSARQKLRLFLFSAVVVVVVFLVAEIVLRIALPAPVGLEPRVYPNLPGDLAPSQEAAHFAASQTQDAALSGDAAPANPDGMRFVMTSTPEGFRGPSVRLDDPRVRVLCLGDSAMMGFLVPDWETFPAQLASRLADSYGPWTETLNAGVIGYTLDDQLEYMTAKGLDLKPDLVVLEIFANDVLEKDTRPAMTLRSALTVHWPMSAVGPSIDNWGLVRGGRALAARLFTFPVPAEPVDRVHDILQPGRKPAMFDNYEKVLREFDALLAEHHIPLVILLSPHHFQVLPWGEYAASDVYQRRMSRMAHGLHARWIDLLPAFRERVRGQSDLYVGNGMYDSHPSGAGQRLKLDAAWPTIQDELQRLGAADAARFWRDSDAAGNRWENRPSLRWGRTWTGKNDAPGIEVRPPAKSVLGPVDLPPGVEFQCELVGGPFADQCRVWITTDDATTTRIVELPIIGPGETRVFTQPVTSGRGGATRLDLLAAWVEGFHPDEKTDLAHPPVVLRRPVFLPIMKSEYKETGNSESKAEAQ